MAAAPENNEMQLSTREEQPEPVALVELKEDYLRCTKPLVGIGWLEVSASNVILQASNLLAVTPGELKNVLTSVETKKGATIDPLIINFTQLLKCVEVVKNGEGHQELFLRATTHDSEGLSRKRNGDQNRLFPLHLETIITIKDKFRENFYAGSELPPAEVKILDDFFDTKIGNDPKDIVFVTEGDLKKRKDREEAAIAAGEPVPVIEEIRPSFRILASADSPGFESSEIYKVKPFPTLAFAPSIYAKKRMREDVLGDQAERAKLVRKLDAPDSAVGVISVQVPGKIISQVETEQDGLVITFLKS